MQEDIDIKENPTMEQMLRAVRNIMTKGMSEDEKKEAVASDQAKPDEASATVNGEGKNDAGSGETGDADEVLELSETSLVEEKTDSEKKEGEADSGDVLDNIDNLLDEKKEGDEKSPETAAAETASSETASAETAVAEEGKAGEPPVANETAEAKTEEAESTDTTETGETPKSPESESIDISESKTEEPVKEEVDTNSESTPGAEGKAAEEKVQNSDEESVEALVSDSVASESIEALKGFKKTIEKPISDGLSFRGGTTMEELVIEMIKPKLSEWLDANLPGIVKHVVEKEVKKLIPDDD